MSTYKYKTKEDLESVLKIMNDILGNACSTIRAKAAARTQKTLIEEELKRRN